MLNGALKTISIIFGHVGCWNVPHLYVNLFSKKCSLQKIIILVTTPVCSVCLRPCKVCCWNLCVTFGGNWGVSSKIMNSIHWFALFYCEHRNGPKKKFNSKHNTLQREWIPTKSVSKLNYSTTLVLTCSFLYRKTLCHTSSTVSLVLWDDADQNQRSEIIRIMVANQINRWIHSGQGFISSFDLPWSEWSRITDLSGCSIEIIVSAQ